MFAAVSRSASTGDLGQKSGFPLHFVNVFSLDKPWPVL